MNYNEFNSNKERIKFTIKALTTAFMIIIFFIFIVYKLSK